MYLDKVKKRVALDEDELKKAFNFHSVLKLKLDERQGAQAEI
jgi:hypothetical protein